MLGCRLLKVFFCIKKYRIETLQIIIEEVIYEIICYLLFVIIVILKC